MAYGIPLGVLDCQSKFSFVTELLPSISMNYKYNCSFSPVVHGVYCCQTDLCNDKGPDEIGGRTSRVTETSTTLPITETTTTSPITETSTTSPITEDSSAITVTKAAASVLLTAAACLYNMA